MNRLTLEEAQEYIPVLEDFTDSVPTYFTVTEPNKEGWCDVTYYTARKKNNYKNLGDGDSYVYVLSNESMPGHVKIGFTRSNPIDRAKQLSSSTGVASPFNVEFSFEFSFFGV